MSHLGDQDKDIKTKLNLHVKQRIKHTKKGDISSDDPGPSTPAPKKAGSRAKGKKQRTPKGDDDLSDKGEEDAEAAPSPRKISTVDVLQLLLNERKRSLMRDPDVLEFIRAKQGRIQ